MTCELCGHHEVPESGEMLDDVQLMDDHLRVMHPEEWFKPMHRPMLGRFSNACEYVVWGSSGALGTGEGKPSVPGFYEASSPREREHQTQKPLEVMRHLTRLVPRGGVVLDPFAGSATTGVAALIEGLDFIGVELSEHYAEVAAQRLRTVERGYRDDGEQGAFELDGESA